MGPKTIVAHHVLLEVRAPPALVAALGLLAPVRSALLRPAAAGQVALPVVLVRRRPVGRWLATLAAFRVRFRAAFLEPIQCCE